MRILTLYRLLLLLTGDRHLIKEPLTADKDIRYRLRKLIICMKGWKREWAIDREEIQQQDSKEVSKKLSRETISHRSLMIILNKAKRSILEQLNLYIKRYSLKTIVQVTTVDMSLTIEAIAMMRIEETMASN